MKYFAGLDVSLKEISICVVDEEGGIVFRKSLPFCPLAVRDALQERKLMPERIVHESGQISIWLQRQLEDLGLRAICIDARIAHPDDQQPVGASREKCNSFGAKTGRKCGILLIRANNYIPIVKQNRGAYFIP